MSDATTVRLSSAGTLQEANAWRLALEQQGVRCRVVGDSSAAGNGVGTAGMRPEVWIQAEDWDKAKAILSARIRHSFPQR
jgi:hypothetical protein